MSAFPARSIRPNACARIRDAKITPCSQGVLPEDKFRLVKPSSLPGMPLGMCRDGAGAHAAPDANHRSGGDGHRSHAACFVDYNR
jgi:hypothetical protein